MVDQVGPSSNGLAAEIRGADGGRRLAGTYYVTVQARWPRFRAAAATGPYQSVAVSAELVNQVIKKNI